MPENKENHYAKSIEPSNRGQFYLVLNLSLRIKYPFTQYS